MVEDATKLNLVKREAISEVKKKEMSAPEATQIIIRTSDSSYQGPTRGNHSVALAPILKVVQIEWSST